MYIHTYICMYIVKVTKHLEIIINNKFTWTKHVKADEIIYEILDD